MPTKKTQPKKPVKTIKTVKAVKPAKTFTKKLETKPFYRKRSFIAPAIVVAAILVVFLGRGFIRTTVIPKGLMPFYTHKVRSTLATENASLQYPLGKLGYSNTLIQSSCALQQAQSIHTEIACGAESNSYSKLSGASGEANIENQAQSIQTLLVQNGWHGGSNGVTLTSLIDGAYLGKDNSPDALYEKIIGSYDCVFDTFISYANPQPYAISTDFSCTHTVNILGAPKDETYNSSKGF